MWDWVGYIDPDFMLSVVTKGQWCSWSDTGANNPAYDKLYNQQGITVDPAKRQAIVYRMQKIIYDNFWYTQLVERARDRRPREELDGLRPAAERLLEALLHGTPRDVTEMTHRRGAGARGLLR